jgi:pimeloyl-ACP methyl ester carboxylesterase
VIGIASAFIVGAMVAWLFGGRLVAPQNHAVPRPSGFDAQEVSIPGAGHAIAGWWIDRGPATPVVLLLHGLRADRSSMVGRAQLLLKHGFSVLLIDLQAQGETPGSVITFGHREAGDVIAARDWIQARAPGRRIGVIGESLGGASVLLAPQPAGFDAVVLEAVYPRIRRAVENRIRMRVGPLASVLAPVLTPLLMAQLGPRLKLSEADLEPIRAIGRLEAPSLIIAGSRDQHTTLAESRELAAAAAAPTQLWVVEGAEHQDLLQYDPAGYENHVVGFLVGNLKFPACES